MSFTIYTNITLRYIKSFIIYALVGMIGYQRILKSLEMMPDIFRRASLKEELEMILEAKVDLVRYWRRMNHYLKRRIGMEARYV